MANFSAFRPQMPDIAAMTDRARRWAPLPDWDTARLQGTGWSARRIEGLGQTLVSGHLSAALAELAPGIPLIGLWAMAERDECAVRIARDRCLLVQSAPLKGTPVRHGAGFVATRADDVFAVFEVEGEGLAGLAAELTSADPAAHSPAAATLVCGIFGLLYRTGRNRARIHVEAAHAAYVWRWLETRPAA
jgi:hypothetical protein